jgi:hypothetical protein
MRERSPKSAGRRRHLFIISTPVVETTRHSLRHDAVLREGAAQLPPFSALDDSADVGAAGTCTASHEGLGVRPPGLGDQGPVGGGDGLGEIVGPILVDFALVQMAEGPDIDV